MASTWRGIRDSFTVLAETSSNWSDSIFQSISVSNRLRCNLHILAMSPEPQFLDPHSSNSSLQELVETQVHSTALHGAHYAIFELNYVLHGWGNYP
jgi:hypothetical protein